MYRDPTSVATQMTDQNLAESLSDEPLWYKDAVIYELHVRAFSDSDADGIGDFQGLTERLDYLQELGITAVWLLPFYPSPLRDDGYDIADYHDVNPMYGTLKDFDAFLDQAHRRGIRVITELVVNHTSDQHAWFQRARRAKPGTPERDFYMWSDTPARYSDARIIFKDFEQSNWTYDPVAAAYYWHRFYSHQPDLNFDSPHTRNALRSVLDFWLGRGVDGMRLDAVPYLYAREGTNCENLPETHAYLRELRGYIDENYKNRMLLAEANQWPEDAAMYFGRGDECHMNFHFPLMPRLFMSLYMEDRYPIIDILEQTPPIPETAQWALFLRNHDELTLEMVTDEERDYMYRIYAQDPRARVNLGIRRRLAPLLDNNRRRIELMNALLFSLPGTPVLYYGDEIGMGDNVYLGDRNGVRTPMQWSADRNAGFSRANPQSLYLPVIIDPAYHYETVNVEAQEQNPSSLWWWMKRMIGLRKRFAAFGRGNVEFLLPRNRRVLAFVREYGSETLLIVANLSRFVQYVELDLSRFRGRVPVELFGNSEFPAIQDKPYFLSLGPHSFFWFSLSLPRRALRDIRTEPIPPLPSLKVRGQWSAVLDNGARKTLEATLPAYILPRRWFRSKTSTIETVEIVDAVAVSLQGTTAGYITLLHVSYTDRDPQTYVLPLQFVSGADATRLLATHPHAVIAELVVVTKEGEDHGFLCDASFDPGFALALLDSVESQRESASAFEKAVLRGIKTQAQEPLWAADAALTPRVGRAEQSNTSIVFGERFILKLYRSIETGLNPDVELSAHLTALGFAHSAPLAGQITYRRKKEGIVTVGALFGFVPNNGDAWQYTQDEVEGFYERAASVRLALAMTPLQTEVYLKAGAAELPNVAYETAGSYFETARLLGQRTAEMHGFLAQSGDDPSFEPETFTPFYRRALYQSLRNATRRGFSTLRAQLATLPEECRETAESVIGSERRILRFFQDVLGHKIDSLRIRVHGDYHLGQVLYTGRDFVIIDFEGEPTRSLNERRIKRCALIDVAGMLRSFQYAAYSVLYARTERVVTAAEKEDLRKWAFAWYQWVGRVFLDAYLGAAERRLFGSTEEIERLMRVYVLEKAIYELAYELDNRPQWVRIPLAGIFHLVQTMDENVPSERSQPKT